MIKTLNTCTICASKAKLHDGQCNDQSGVVSCSNNNCILHTRAFSQSEWNNCFPDAHTKQAHEEAAGMNLDDSFFTSNGIDPNADPTIEKGTLMSNIQDVCEPTQVKTWTELQAALSRGQPVELSNFC